MYSFARKNQKNHNEISIGVISFMSWTFKYLIGYLNTTLKYYEVLPNISLKKCMIRIIMFLDKAIQRMQYLRNDYLQKICHRNVYKIMVFHSISLWH